MEEEARRETPVMDTRKEPSTKPKMRWRGRNICVVITVAVVLLAVIAVVVGVTLFKAKHAVTTFDSVNLRDLDLSIDAPRLAVHVNLTVDARVSVTNPNRVGFKYDSTSVLLRYRGQNIGDAPIFAGEIGARETTSMNVTVTITGDRLLTSSQFFSDVISGVVPLSTYMRLTGKVHILFKIHVKSVTTCDLFIDIANTTLTKQSCKFHTNI
ncbi:PREDICTED: uncharacterized protein LOC109159236 [Ipomoea nil]|uniref:uncharacterized protein LOC109159236 n=1 Tax=Ipomoea nil TaxID=35883 RepID=UPI000900E081|nr:PREDICTED: uncharacterized protein LOC109159236 [Ipomoea nil]